jgi:hypothetical protein
VNARACFRTRCAEAHRTQSAGTTPRSLWFVCSKFCVDSECKVEIWWHLKTEHAQRSIIGPLGRPDVIFQRSARAKHLLSNATLPVSEYLIEHQTRKHTPRNVHHTKTITHNSFKVTNSTKQATIKSSRWSFLHLYSLLLLLLRSPWDSRQINLTREVSFAEPKERATKTTRLILEK